MQPQIRSCRFPARRGANSLRMCGNDQAFEAAPAPSQLEQPQAVQHGIDPRFGDRMQDDAEQAAGPGEIPFPQVVPARAGQRREDHFGDFRALPQPLCDGQRAAGVTLEPHRQRAQATQREETIVAAGGHAHVGPQLVQPRVRRLAADDDPVHHVGMAAEIFGAGLQRDVGAVGERRESQWRRPGVVDQHQRAARMRSRGDRRHILDLER